MSIFVSWKYLEGEPCIREQYIDDVACDRGKRISENFEYVKIIVDGVAYPSPKDLGREPLCNLCDHQLGCLAGESHSFWRADG